MTLQAFEIPVVPAQAQRLSIQLGQQTYNLRLTWCAPASCWILNINDQDDAPIVQGLPLITGAYLLEQYGYLGIVGQLLVQSDNDPNTVPTFSNLGVTGHLYYLTGVTPSV